MPDITQVTGVGVAALSVYLMWKLSVNHISHNTKAIEELRDILRELKEFLTDHLK